MILKIHTYMHLLNDNRNLHFHLGIGNFGDRYFGTEFKIHGVPHYTCPDEN